MTTDHDLLARIDEWIVDIEGLIELDGERMNHSTLQEYKVTVASLKANKAVLEKKEKVWVKGTDAEFHQQVGYNQCLADVKADIEKELG